MREEKARTEGTEVTVELYPSYNVCGRYYLKEWAPLYFHLSAVATLHVSRQPKRSDDPLIGSVSRTTGQNSLRALRGLRAMIFPVLRSGHN